MSLEPSERRQRVPIISILALASALLLWWSFPSELPLWRGIAIVSAWLGTAMLAVCTVLMVREPHLARALGGLERCYLWHHRFGVFAYLAVVVHPLALALDGWTESPHVAWASLAPWLLAWPVWLGWGALVLIMGGLAATFNRRLTYRRWRGLHHLLGIGVLLAFSHVWILLGEPAPPLGIVAIGVLALSWRLLAADLGLAALPYRVTAVGHPAAGVIEASIAPRGAALAVVPGQFVLAAFDRDPHYRGCGEYHPFTVSAIEAEHRLRVTVKGLGSCSTRLQALEPGALLRLQGPFGSFLSEAADRPELWIAGGIGITPFIAALRAEPRVTPTTLIYLYRTAADAAFLEELASLASKDANFKLIANATGDRPPAVETLTAGIAQLTERRVYLCGPAAMVDAMTRGLIELGTPPGNIRYERFDFRL
ncbi:ferredoxin reductase family protein [Trinickia dabaoshanensis]|nr:ferredoxin reductase family protein [Trinickia dabaoshanensis]